MLIYEKKKFNTENLNAKTGNKARIYIFTTPIQYHTGGPSQYNKAKERKGTQLEWKKQIFLIDGQHNCLCRKCQGIYQNISRTYN